MNKFSYGNADLPGVYYDEENRRHLNTIRRAHTEIALDLVYKNRKEEARKALEKADKMMLEENFPYGMISRGNEHNRLSMLFLQACYQAEDPKLAAKVLKGVKTDLQQQLKFYNSLTGMKADNMIYEKNNAEKLLQDLGELEKAFGTKQPGASLENGGVIGGDSAKKDSAGK